MVKESFIAMCIKYTLSKFKIFSPYFLKNKHLVGWVYGKTTFAPWKNF
jgi:hypothetical protein